MGKKVAVYLWARRRRGRLEVSGGVQRMRDEHMLRVKRGPRVRRPVGKRLTLAEFWTEQFVPSMKTRALAPRTIQGYEETWELYLEPSMAQRHLDLSRSR